MSPEKDIPNSWIVVWRLFLDTPLERKVAPIFAHLMGDCELDWTMTETGFYGDREGTWVEVEHRLAGKFSDVLVRVLQEGHLLCPRVTVGQIYCEDEAFVEVEGWATGSLRLGLNCADFRISAERKLDDSPQPR